MLTLKLSAELLVRLLSLSSSESTLKCQLLDAGLRRPEDNTTLENDIDRSTDADEGDSSDDIDAGDDDANDGSLGNTRASGDAALCNMVDESPIDGIDNISDTFMSTTLSTKG